MGIDVSTGLTSITGNVTVQSTAAIHTPSSTQDYMGWSTQGNGAVQNVYTVPAGKKFTLFFAHSLDLSGSLSVYKTDGTSIVAFNQGSAALYAVPTQPPCGIMKYAAGEIVKANCTNGKYYFLSGVLENV